MPGDQKPQWLRSLERILERGERGDPEAMAWFGFANLTAISVAVIAIVVVAWWWI